ncbi:MAG: decaprenyl-phosphate phosphoribosyltransferase [Dehalococcoidia bacterium]
MATLSTAAGGSAVTLSRGLIRTARPKQMVKNGLVLVPLFFTINKWWDTSDIIGMSSLVGRSLAAMALFVALSAAVYFINDALDVERDRAHPVKRNRPIAAGIIPVPLAWTVAIALAVGALVLSFLIRADLGYAATGYMGLMLGYSLFIKHMVILDVMAIAAGFVLRAVAGALAIESTILHRGGVDVQLDLTISPWLFVVTAMGALFIALVKRRSELVEAGDRAVTQRGILSEYSEKLLDQFIVIVATSTLVAYTLYTFSGGITEANVPENNSMMLTIPFVGYGLFRYLYLMYRHRHGEAPEEILITDRPLMINIVLWLITAAAVLLVNR